MDTKDDHPGNPGEKLPTTFEKVWHLKEFTENGIAILGGLVLAFIFWMMPFTEVGAIEPWYFWFGSGLVALAASVFMSWVFFQPPRKRKRKTSDGTMGNEYPE